MKNLTDLRETVETGVDPRLQHAQFLLHKRHLREHLRKS